MSNNNKPPYIAIPENSTQEVENNWLAIRTLFKTINTIISQVGSPDHSSKSLIQQIASLSSQISAAITRIATNEKNIKKNKTEIISIITSISELQTLLLSLEDRLEDIEDEFPLPESTTTSTNSNIDYFLINQVNPVYEIYNSTGFQTINSYLSWLRPEMCTRSIFISNTSTAEQIQNEINSVGKLLLDDVDIIFQIEDSPTLSIVGDAVEVSTGIVGIPVQSHGLNIDDYFQIENSNNYNGDYTVQPGSTTDLIYIQFSSFVAETFSNSNIRIAQKLDNYLKFSSYFGGGRVFLQGNLNDSFYSFERSVLLDFRGLTYAVQFWGVNVFIQLYKVKVVFSNFGLYLINNTLKGSSNGVCYISNSSGVGIMSGAVSTLKSNYFKNCNIAIKASNSPHTYSSTNITVENVNYGLEASGSIIYTASTQPTGSIADTLCTNGGDIR